jgi:hypothetical protein
MKEQTPEERKAAKLESQEFDVIRRPDGTIIQQVICLKKLNCGATPGTRFQQKLVNGYRLYEAVGGSWYSGGFVKKHLGTLFQTI